MSNNLLPIKWTKIGVQVGTYYINLIIAYPFGLLALGLALNVRKVDPKNPAHKVVLAIVTTGVVASAVAVFLYR